MNIDIATTVKVILVFIGISIFASLFFAFRSIQTGKHLEFFQKRQKMIAYGWRLVLLAVVLLLAWFWVYKKAEPVAYRYFPPSPTMTRTPTITLTPTITPTLKETLTPTITETLAQTYTPSFPEEAQQTIQTQVGPDSSAIFSALEFSTKLGTNRLLEDTKTTFTAPVTHIYGGFSFDKMAIGVQWTAAWYYEGTLFYMETKSWTLNDGSGGYGYSDCEKPADQWLPGEYEVQIFVGQTWKTSGRFTITGAAPAATATMTPTKSQPVITPAPSATGT